MIRVGLLALVLTLLPAAATLATSEPRHTSEFEERVRSYLLANPEILFEMNAILDRRELAARRVDEAAIIKDRRDELFGDARDGRIGQGEPAFVEFIDYNCGFCKRNHRDVVAWLENNPARSIVIKELPILGDASMVAARVALAIKSIYGDEGYRIIQRIFIEQPGRLEVDVIEELVETANWDTAAIRHEMNSDRITRQIEANRELAEALGINGTPAFVYTGGIGHGFQDYQALDAGARMR